MRRSRRVGVMAALLLPALFALAGCHAPHVAPAVSPKVAPPVVKEAGILRAGVDLDRPPFGGTDAGQQAGIDVDVASAIAGRLGLKVRLVDVKPSQVATALARGDVDIALSAPFSADVFTRASMAGTYLSDGPALFSRDASGSAPATVAISALDDKTIGVEKGSEAYWLLVDELGSDGVTAYPSLADALTGLRSGEVQLVAGDALIGAYIARDQPGVHYAGALAPAHLLGVAVAADNTRLSDAVRTTLDRLIADGALDAIRTAWVGSLPKLPLQSDETSAEPSDDTSAAP